MREREHLRLRQRAIIASTHILALRSFIHTFRVASTGGIVRVSTMGEHLRLRQLAVITLSYFLVLQFYILTFREESTLYGYATAFVEGFRRILKLGRKAFGLRQLTTITSLQVLAPQFFIDAIRKQNIIFSAVA